MARPNKEALKIREAIEKIGIFKRDSFAYTHYEDLCKPKNIDYMRHLFFNISRMRNKISMKDNTLIEIIKKLKDIDSMSKKAQEAIDIDWRIGLYYQSIALFTIVLSSEKETKEYDIASFIDIQMFKRIFPEYDTENLGKNLKNNFYKDGMCNIDIFAKNYTHNEKSNLMENIKKEITNNYPSASFKTKISIFHPYTVNDYPYFINTRYADVEIDFTKSKKDILTYIEKMKDDFDNKKLIIDTDESICNNIDDYDISDLNAKHPKGFGGKTADILFIYDCKKVNKILNKDIFTNNYIINEISVYWELTKGIKNYTFNSLEDYYRIGKKYIDKKIYKKHI